VKHLHQTLEGYPVENLKGFRHPADGQGMSVSPFPLRTVNTPFTFRDMGSHPRKDQTTMMVCPTDMHVVPTVDRPIRVPIISAAFEEEQIQRVPRSNKSLFNGSTLYQLALRTFMRPSICEDFGPYLPVWSHPVDDEAMFTPFRRITLDRSDHVIIIS
jgi:hypothetical protein